MIVSIVTFRWRSAGQSREAAAVFSPSAPNTWGNGSGARYLLRRGRTAARGGIICGSPRPTPRPAHRRAGRPTATERDGRPDIFYAHVRVDRERHGRHRVDPRVLGFVRRRLPSMRSRPRRDRRWAARRRRRVSRNAATRPGVRLRRLSAEFVVQRWAPVCGAGVPVSRALRQSTPLSNEHRAMIARGKRCSARPPQMDQADVDYADCSGSRR